MDMVISSVSFTDELSVSCKGSGEAAFWQPAARQDTVIIVSKIFLFIIPPFYSDFISPMKFLFSIAQP
jgi:hypothetical protein